MFKKFFNKVKSFIDIVWNGVKKIGTFIKNHFDIVHYDSTIAGNDLLITGIVCFAIAIAGYMLPQYSTISISIMSIEIGLTIVKIIKALFFNSPKNEVTSSEVKG